MHCADPSCAQACPAAAIEKGGGGIVAVNPDRCIGCKYCYQACPFEVPHYTDQGMDKCDCCRSIGVSLGDTPRCVDACKFKALHYGPLDQLMEASNGNAKPLEAPTGPSLLLQ